MREKGRILRGFFKASAVASCPSSLDLRASKVIRFFLEIIDSSNILARIASDPTNLKIILYHPHIFELPGYLLQNASRETGIENKRN